MLKHNAESGDGTFGVSRNEYGIIIHVGSFKGIDRIKLSPEEADFLCEIISEQSLLFRKDQTP